MATLTLRSTKGAPLTFAELDSNFTDLNSEAVKNLTYVAPNLVITQGDDTSLSVNIRDIVTYSSLNANGDVGEGSTQVARGNHVHAGLHYSGTQELTMLDGRLSLGNGTVLSYGQNRNITKVGAGIEDFYIYLGRARPGTHSIKYYYQGHSSYNSIQLDFALDHGGGGTNGVSLPTGLNTVKLFKSAGAAEVSSIHIVKRDSTSAEVYIKHTIAASIPAGNIINVNWSVQSQGLSTDAFYFPTDPLYTLNAGNTVTDFIQEVTTTGHTNFISVGGDGNALTNLNWNAISGIPLTTSATDNTANRITKVGDFGLGAEAINSNNFDIITDSGFYRNSSSTAIGLPVASNVILMVHNERSINYAVQTAVQINTNRSWNRSKSNGTWTSWVEILTDNNTGTVVTSDITTTSIDNTSGRVTKVGDFGIGATVASNTLLNSTEARITGVYRYTTADPNAPDAATNGTFQTYSYSSTRAHQIAFRSTRDNMWTRNWNGTLWSSWVEILTESSTINAATLDNLDSTQFLRSDVSDQMNGQLSGGFGAITTGGTLDWNHVTNARSGNGVTLLRGSTSVNGPSTAGQYFHPFSFEYSSKNGSGNMTQYAIPYQDGGDMYFRTRVSAYWGDWRTILTDFNLPTYAVPNRGVADWSSAPSVISSTVGMLGWKNFGNGHVIFDASQSTSPTGSTVNNTNSDQVWSLTRPTLMGWNGANTFGVRVDSARNADYLGNITPSQFLRSDVDGVVTANIRFNDNKYLKFGTGNDAHFFCNGSHMYTDLKGGIGNWYIRDGTTTRFTFDDDGTFVATNKIKVNTLEVDAPKTYHNAGNQVITRQGVSTYINRWASGNKTYTLSNSTFLTGDKVYVSKMAEAADTLTVITDSGSIYLPDGTNNATQTLSVVGTVCFEKLTGGNWWARRA